MKAAEDKHYILGELFNKYEQTEGFLSRGEHQDFRT